MNDNKTLVAYFSCSGVTRLVAEELADVADADIYEIEPEIPYTQADLDWRNKQSRSSLEMNDQSSRPAIAGKIADMDKYDVVFVGFPIWWYVAPTIINAFLESYDFSGKTVIPFATSGSSDMGDTDAKLHPSCSAETKWIEGKLLNHTNRDELVFWVDSLKN